MGLFFHSATVRSGCRSSSGALEALLCRLTFECLGSSSSSKLLNSGSLETKRAGSGLPALQVPMPPEEARRRPTGTYSSVSLMRRKSSCSTTAPEISVWNGTRTAETRRPGATARASALL